MEMFKKIIGPRWIPIPKNRSSDFKVFNFGPTPVCYRLDNRVPYAKVLISNGGEVVIKQEWYLGTNWIYIKDLPSGYYTIENIEPLIVSLSFK